MPSTAITPFSLVYAGGAATFEPARVSIEHARLTYNGGAVSFSTGATTLEAIDLRTLDVLYRAQPIVDAVGNPSQAFQQQWQDAMEGITDAINSITSQVNDNTALLAQIQAAQTLARAANDNAAAVADTVNITSSYTDPTNVLTANNDGSIDIIAHKRRFTDGTYVNVNAGSVSGFAAGNYVSVYYQDAAREGGSVSYQGTLNAVAQTGDTFVAGQATIPEAGEPPAEGTSPSAPGYSPQGGYAPDYLEP